MQQYDLIETIPNSILQAEMEGVSYSVTGISASYLKVRMSIENYAERFVLAGKNRENCIDISIKRDASGKEVPCNMILKYLDYRKQCFQKVLIEQVSLVEVCEKSNMTELIFSGFEKNQEYQEAFSFLIKQYTDYIYAKTGYEDNHFSDKICGYPYRLDEELTESQEAFWKTNFDHRNFIDFWRIIRDKGFETAILLDSKLKLTDAERKRWKFTEHIRRIYIGNEYCFEQCPNVEYLNAILAAIQEKNVNVTLVLPPIQEYRLAEAVRLTELLECHGSENAEVVVNDWGILEKLKGSRLKLAAGHLLLKQRRDPRSIYRVMPQNVKVVQEYELGQQDQKAMQSVLKEKGIQRIEISCLSGNSSKNHSAAARSLHVPLYQTNTSSFCTLKAVMEENDRGKQLPVKECIRYCEKYFFAYPKHLGMIGIGNSLFGCAGNEIGKEKSVENMKLQGVDRVVWNGPISYFLYYIID